MPAAPDECLKTLRDAGLRGAAEVVPVLDTDEVGITLAVESGSWFEAWQTARQLVPATGRWPIAVEDLGAGMDVFSRFDMDRVTGLDLWPRAILERAAAFDLDATLRAEEQRQNADWRPEHDDIEWDLNQTRELFGDAPTLDQLLGEIGPAPGRLDVERFLFEWERERTPLQPPDDSYLDWFEPPAAKIVLLPDPAPISCWAYVGGYEWGHPHPDARTAALLRWNSAYGAEPAANWGTMQQIVVPKPPGDPGDAFRLAYEISLLWPDTAGGGNGISTRQLARDLLGRSRWFLHYRP